MKTLKGECKMKAKKLRTSLKAIDKMDLDDILETTGGAASASWCRMLQLSCLGQIVGDGMGVPCMSTADCDTWQKYCRK